MGKATGRILVIVESPGKVDKIQHILGDDYLVMASVGHIMDLDKSKFSIDVDNNFALSYTILDGKEQVVKKLKSAYSDSVDLLIATDKDREGEIIGENIAFQLKVKDPKRISFTEITKKEILDAVKHPGKINNNLVDAQKLRRVFDRMIGYKLSPLLWKSMGSGQLSAGRVQSVVVKLVVDKENDIKKFFSQDSVSYFKTNGEFKNSKNNMFKSQLYTTKKQDIVENDDENKKLANGDESDEESDTKKTKKSKKSKNADSDSEDVEDSENEAPKKPKKSAKTSKKSKSKKGNTNDEDEDDDKNEVQINKKGDVARIPSEEEANDIMKAISKSEFKIVDTVKRESIRQPSAPFTTSTLQQEAARKFGFGSKRTMTAAQHLYEGGYITYMRTDSTNLSDDALQSIGEFIVGKYGENYHRKKTYAAKKKNTQEAHEAVRPTDAKVLGVSPDSAHKISTDEIKLYTLIWKRTIASQMSPAKFDVYATEINISKLEDYYFVNQVENNTFLGFLAVYNLSNDKNEVEAEEKDGMNVASVTEEIKSIEIPKVGTILTAISVTSTQDYKKPPVRYNEASLVSKLDPKHLNIGRPSTYAAIIDKIQSAGYVKKEDIEGENKNSIVLSWDGHPKAKIIEKHNKISLGKEKNKFVPTSVGILVDDFLKKHFSEIIDYKFTAEMENNLDSVARGEIKWTKVADIFWKKFSPIVEKLSTSIVPKEMADSHARELGIHPDNGNKIIATIGKYGPMVKMIDKDNPKSIAYGPIKKPFTLDKITLADAVKIFQYPKNMGRYKGKIVGLYKGAYGFYLKVGTETVALKHTEENIDKFTLEDAVSAIEGKSAGQLWKGSDAKNIYVVKEGEFGKYINAKPVNPPKTKIKGKMLGINVKLPEGIEVSDLTPEKAAEIINNAWEKKKQGRAKKSDAKSGKKSSEKKETSEDDEKPKKVVKKTKKVK